MAVDPVRLAGTKAWLKGKNDLRGAEIDLGADPPLVEDALFHCQQAVEKSFRAFLAFHDEPFRKTHNLEELGEACLKIDPTFKGLVDDAVPLTEYAWAFRNPANCLRIRSPRQGKPSSHRGPCSKRSSTEPASLLPKFHVRPARRERRLARHDHCDGLGAHGKAQADGVHSLTAFSFDADLTGLDSQRGGELPLHAGNKRPKLRPLEFNRRVNVDNGEASARRQPPSFAQEDQARSVVPAGRGVGEMSADIAERGGAEQGVRNGVRERVAVRVAERAFLKRDFDPAQNKLPPAHQAMNVAAQTDAEKRLKGEG